jgi:hypothetical protein
MSNAILISLSLILEMSQILMIMINKSESLDVTSENGSYEDDEEGIDNDNIKNVEISKMTIIYTTRGSVINV